MLLHRSSPVAAVVALLAALLAVPATAGAATTAPTLRAPAANAAPVTEGGSVEFEWSGTLQGDSDALDRSFFRLEIVRATAMPSGTQATWPSDVVENFVQTDPGATTTKVRLGVPSAGDYRWRVCAWGVTDDLLANEIQQLPGGCSGARAFTSVAATITRLPVGELKIEEKKQVAGEVRRVFVERPAEPAQPTTSAPDPVVQPAPVADPAPVVREEEPLLPARFSEVARTKSQLGHGSSLGGVGGSGSDDGARLDADQVAGRRGITSRVISGLGANLPIVPIPFWTLLLPLACIPLLRVWRGELLAMFDWADGSIDGKGTYDDGLGNLAPVLVASEVKDRSTTADGEALAPAPLHVTSAPERRGHAA